MTANGSPLENATLDELAGEMAKRIRLMSNETERFKSAVFSWSHGRGGNYSAPVRISGFVRHTSESLKLAENG